jgi:hypothetical protein
LFARFAGALPAGADVENALFYNLDAAGVFAAMVAGASFEMNPDAPADEVRYEYETGPPTATFQHWLDKRILATFDAKLIDAQPKLASIWWALRPPPGRIHTDGPPRSPRDPFLVRLTISGPSPGLTPPLLKTLLDGSICALQSESDLAKATEVADPHAVLSALIDTSPSVLGARRRLVHRHGAGIQWEPDDDYCVAATVLFAPAIHWRISWSVAVAHAQPSFVS